MKKLFSLVLLVSTFPALGQELSATNKVTNPVVTSAANTRVAADSLESKAQQLATELEQSEAIARRAKEILAQKRARERYEAMSPEEREGIVSKSDEKSLKTSVMDMLTKASHVSELSKKSFLCWGTC